MYDEGNDEAKRQIATTVIEKIHDSGGRFLQQQQQQPQQQQLDATTVWKVVSAEDLRKKILQAFRNLDASKRKVDDATSGTLIAGDPLPNDVIFGRAQRNPGSKLLHRLIKDHFEEYESLGRGVKMRLVETIMQAIKDQDGRFLLKAPPSAAGGTGNSRWLEVSHNNARERISKYFRNYRRPPKR